MTELGAAMDRLRDGDEGVERELAAHGDAAVEALAGELSDGAIGSVSAATFLRMAASSGAVAALVERAENGELDDRATAIAALGHGRSAAAVTPLVRCLDVRALWVDAVSALGCNGSAPAQTALRDVFAECVGADAFAAIERSGAQRSWSLDWHRLRRRRTAGRTR